MTTKSLYCELPVATIKAALLFAAKDDITRKSTLVGACVEHGPQGVRLIATDGHRMLVQHIAADSETETTKITPEEKTTRFVLARDVLEGVVKLAKKQHSVACVWEQDTNPDPERPGVVIVSKARITINALATNDAQDDYGRFPEYERIVPHETNGQTSQFNAAYLHDIGKAKTLLTGGRGEYFSVMHNGDSAALVILTDSAFAIIMPMRGAPQQSATLPSWFVAGKAAKKAA